MAKQITVFNALNSNSRFGSSKIRITDKKADVTLSDRVESHATNVAAKQAVGHIAGIRGVSAALDFAHPFSAGPPTSRTKVRACAGAIIFLASTSAVASASGNDFQSAMVVVMDRMHHGMNSGYSGDPDRDFAVMMIPHHNGAVEMAALQLRHGSDPRLRRLAQGIIVEQTQEIQLMRHILQEYEQKPASLDEQLPKVSARVGVDR